MDEILLFLKQRGGHAPVAEVRKRVETSDSEWESRLFLLLESGKVRAVGQERLWLSDDVQRLRDQVEPLLSRLAEAAPWKSGWTLVEIASLLGRKSGKDEAFEALLDSLCERGELRKSGILYAPGRHVPSLAPEAQDLADSVIERLRSAHCSPKDWIDLLEELVDDRLLRSRIEEYLLGTNRVVRLSDRIVTLEVVLEEARCTLKEAHPEGFTASEARKTLGTSRKFVIPILEWMDEQGWTLRDEEYRQIQQV